MKNRIVCITKNARVASSPLSSRTTRGVRTVQIKNAETSMMVHSHSFCLELAGPGPIAKLESGVRRRGGQLPSTAFLLPISSDVFDSLESPAETPCSPLAVTQPKATLELRQNRPLGQQSHPVHAWSCLEALRERCASFVCRRLTEGLLHDTLTLSVFYAPETLPSSTIAVSCMSHGSRVSEGSLL